MTVFGGTLVARPWKKKVGRVEHGAPDLPFRVVGDRGFEPLTSSVSRKRSPPELIARSDLRFYAFGPLHTASTAHKVRSADD